MDAYSSLIKTNSKEEYVINAKEIEAFTQSLEKLLKNMNNSKKVIVFDSLSTMVDNCGKNCINVFSLWKKLIHINHIVFIQFV